MNHVLLPLIGAPVARDAGSSGDRIDEEEEAKKGSGLATREPSFPLSPSLPLASLLSSCASLPLLLSIPFPTFSLPLTSARVLLCEASSLLGRRMERNARKTLLHYSDGMNHTRLSSLAD